MANDWLFGKRILKHSPSFLQDVSTSIGSFARMNLISSVISGLLVPTIVGVFCTYFEVLEKINPLLFWGPVLVLMSFSILYTATSLGVKSAPEAMLEIMAMNSKINGLQKALEHLTTVDYLCNIWRVMVDESIRQKITIPTQANSAIQNLCDLFLDNKDTLYHFSADELWNFVLYIYDDVDDTLKPVWRRKHKMHPAVGNGRSWRPGQGHVGLSFANGSPRTTTDARDSEVAELLRAPQGAIRQYDDTAYVALQTQPIRTDGGRILGVLAATSDKPGRYDKANSLALVHLSGEIATLLSFAWTRPLSELVIHW